MLENENDMEMSRFEKERRKVLDLLDYELNVQHPTHQTSVDSEFTVYLYLNDLKKFELHFPSTKTMLTTLDERKEVQLKNSFDEEADPGGPYTAEGHETPIFEVVVPSGFSVKIPETITSYAPPKIGEVTFEAVNGVMRYKDLSVSILLHKKMYFLCRAMFARDPLQQVGWDEIADEIGDPDLDKEERQKVKKSLTASVTRVNNKVRNSLKIRNDLLSWSNGVLTRNF